MASVFWIFGYMAATAFLLGFGAVTLLRRLAGEVQANRLPPALDVPACCMAGLVCATVYAQLWSLFGGVGLAANLVLLTLCAAVLLAQRQALRRYVEDRLTGSSCHAAAVSSDYTAANSGHASVTAFHDALPPHRPSAKSAFLRLLPALLLALLFAYGASRGYMHYDSDLYHAQAIRWIEEYGVVPGLANLHTRLGYNSASFALSALYSFAFLGGRSYHACAGFLALLTAAESLKILGVFRGRAIVLADFARLAALYYLFAVFDELVSPASDYFMVLCAFYLVIRFLALAERRERSYFPYALLAMLAVYTVTVKLSAAGLLLLAAAPVVMVLRRRRLRPFLVFLGTALLIAAPFLIRNVILTGWLVYPMTALDLFHFDWQVPAGVAAADAREIAVWGRGYSDVSRYGEPLVYWISGWFHQQATANKLFLLAALAALPVMLGWVVWEKNRLRRAAQAKTAADTEQGHAANAAAPNAKQTSAAENAAMPKAATAACDTMSAARNPFASDRRRFRLITLALAAVVCALAFWFWNAPLMRYGCVFVYLTAFLGAGLVFTGGGAQEKLERRCCLVVCALFLAAKCFSGVLEQLPDLRRPYWIFQQDYGKYEAVAYEIGGQTFYYAASGDQLGYDAFPSSPARAKIRLRGEGLREGFAYDDGTGRTGVDNTDAQSGAAGDGNTARASTAATGSSSWQADEATTGNPWWIGNATTGNSWQADAATTGSSWQTDSAATGSSWQADEATTGSSWQADNATTGSSYQTDSAATGSSWQADTSSLSSLSPDAQLDAIARNMAAQCFEENLLASPFPYYYAVTDLDQNGSPELLTSISLGTSHTATTKIWAVEADGSLTRRMYSPAVPEDGDVQLVDSSLPVYRNSESGTLQYIAESVAKTGLYRTVDRVTALSFQDNILKEYLLGERDAYPASSEETAEITADYYGFSGGKHTISEEEFGRLADDTYGAANRQTAHFLWKTMDEDDPLLYDETLRRQAVQESFAGFYID